MKKGTYLFIVHDTNDEVTQKVVQRFVNYCETQEEIDNTVTRLLNSTHGQSLGVTEYGWVEVYYHTETQNRWPARD